MPSYDDLLAPGEDVDARLQQGAPFRCLKVRGRDAVGFVHRLCSQDVEGLSEGHAAPALFLTAKGKIETLAWLARRGEDVCIEVQVQELDKLSALLERYHFAERLAIEPMGGWSCNQLVGRRAWQAAGIAGPAANPTEQPLWFAGACRGLEWVRWHGEPSRLESAAPPAAPLADDAWQRLRVAAGLPWVGVDVDTTTLALEGEFEDHVSTTKGCYTGQEIVARIHTYGHTNRRLCRLRVVAAGSAPLSLPMTIADAEGDPVGRLTSLAPAAAGTDGRTLALGFVPREFAAPGTRLRLGADGEVEVV